MSFRASATAKYTASRAKVKHRKVDDRPRFAPPPRKSALHVALAQTMAKHGEEGIFLALALVAHHCRKLRPDVAEVLDAFRYVEAPKALLDTARRETEFAWAASERTRRIRRIVSRHFADLTEDRTEKIDALRQELRGKGFSSDFVKTRIEGERLKRRFPDRKVEDDWETPDRIQELVQALKSAGLPLNYSASVELQKLLGPRLLGDVIENDQGRELTRDQAIDRVVRDVLVTMGSLSEEQAKQAVKDARRKL